MFSNENGLDDGSGKVTTNTPPQYLKTKPLNMYKFLHPITDFKLKSVVCNLEVTYRPRFFNSTGELRTIDIVDVQYDEKSVGGLIQAISPDEWDSINFAARHNFDSMESIKEVQYEA